MSKIIKSEIRQYYNRFAQSDVTQWQPEKFEKLHNFSRARKYFMQRKIKTALSMVSLGKDARVLDVGCNVGQYSFYFAEMGYQVTGVDISENAISVARKKAEQHGVKNISFEVGDVERLSDTLNEKFDVVFSFSALRYVPDLLSALKQIKRVLKPNGVIVLDFPNKYCPWFKMLKTKFGINIHMHDHHYSSRLLYQLMESAGFEDISVKKILFSPPYLPSRLVPIFQVIDRVAENTPLLNEFAAILMCKGKPAYEDGSSTVDH